MKRKKLDTCLVFPWAACVHTPDAVIKQCSEVLTYFKINHDNIYNLCVDNYENDVYTYIKSLDDCEKKHIILCVHDDMPANIVIELADFLAKNQYDTKKHKRYRFLYLINLKTFKADQNQVVKMFRIKG